jgi:hypothetical protein
MTGSATSTLAQLENSGSILDNLKDCFRGTGHATDPDTISAES